jgi:hypothetical protein
MQIYPATKNIRENGVRLDFLDWIRGLAVASVFLFHCLRPVLGVNQMPWGSGFFRDFSAAPQLIPFFPLTYGSYGVAAFFVLRAPQFPPAASNETMVRICLQTFLSNIPAVLARACFFLAVAAALRNP